ncbi:hypothetical protein ACLI4Q_10925 [Natrialbaceae archaeon A-CW1-1]
MEDAIDRLRTEVERRLNPPVDVLIDPSLLIATTTIERLSASQLFTAQTQATLGQSPTTPRIGNLYVPASFKDLILQDHQIDVQNTQAWNFFKGQAESAYRADIADLLEAHNVASYAEDRGNERKVNLSPECSKSERHHRLNAILIEELAFLASGGVVLSRTPQFVRALRDTGVPTVDVGDAQLHTAIRSRLTDIGYQDPATTCVIGVPNLGPLIDALAGQLIDSPQQTLLYRIGQ